MTKLKYKINNYKNPKNSKEYWKIQSSCIVNGQKTPTMLLNIWSVYLSLECCILKKSGLIQCENITIEPRTNLKPILLYDQLEFDNKQNHWKHIPVGTKSLLLNILCNDDNYNNHHVQNIITVGNELLTLYKPSKKIKKPTASQKFLKAGKAPELNDSVELVDGLRQYKFPF